MNKQQLATRIWASANKMRSSKIESGEYKDFILGFIFYKYLSDQEEKFLIEQGWDEDSIKEVEEADLETVKFVQDNLGYFIGYKNMFSTWLGRGRDFGIKDVTEALSAFNRLISTTHKKVFNNIFFTLQTILTKLGDTDASRSSAIGKLFQLIKDIPTTGNQGYDVLGYIYEYLIGQFAANAGKKGGEFYTPHEVSQLMAEIVAHHLKDKETIDIYDPTSGSGSLLITIGQAVAKHNDNRDAIKYYAQELVPSTYNLTRMNLVMRGIKPHNIITRNGDTLQQGCDWPYFDSEEDKENTYQMVRMDAVVSNPPYSQEWDRPADKESDKRFKDYGLAPKKPADYAFLLHELYHLKHDGIMTIVLPHGVLFRPGDEAEIRKNLIERGHIEAIIGLPAGIFFGTPIATIIMVVRQQRSDNDILFIDASKYFVKIGKEKKLQQSDIRRIFDVVTTRPQEVERFSRLVSRQEIRDNNYDLSIPKYVNSSDAVEQWDFYSSLLGGIPQKEISMLQRYWDVMPRLKSDLFSEGEYVECKVADIMSMVENHPDIETLYQNFHTAFNGYEEYLREQLMSDMSTVNIAKGLDVLSMDLYNRLQNFTLLNRYAAFQDLNDCWEVISVDLELIQNEGAQVIKEIEPNMVIEKKDGEEYEVQKGWRGRIMPFDLVQTTFLPEIVEEIVKLQNRLSEVSYELSAIIEEATEEDEAFLNDDNDGIDSKKLAAALKGVLENVTSPEIAQLQKYLALTKKGEKLAFIEHHPELQWSSMAKAKDDTYAKNTVNKRIVELQASTEFPEDSFDAHVKRVYELIQEQKELKAAIKQAEQDLSHKTIWTIEALNDEQIKTLLNLKWVKPITETMLWQFHQIKVDLVTALQHLTTKYSLTAKNIEKQIHSAENQLHELISNLVSSVNDKEALKELNQLHNGGSIQLSALFPQNGDSQPKLRFAGFTEPWKKRQLSYYLTVSKDKNKAGVYTKEDVLSVAKEAGVVNQIQYQGKSLAGASLRGYDVILPNEVVYTKSPLRDQPYGIIKTNRGNAGIVSSLYAVYKPLETVIPEFVEHYFDSDERLNNFLRPIVKKGAKNTLNISDEGILEAYVLFPERDEQAMIAKLCDLYNNIIQLYQLKVDKLRTLKSAMLDKLFV